MLTFFEPPSWCRDASDLQIVQRNQDYGSSSAYGHCKILFDSVGVTADMVENQALYPNFGAMLLTISQARSIEIICVGLIIMHMLLQFGDDGFFPSFFFYRGYKRWVHISQCVIVSLLLLSISTHDTTFNPFLRMAILATYLKGVQRELVTLFKMTPHVMKVLFLLGVIVIFYAWFGVVIFKDSKQGRTFPNLIEGMWTLYISITTANYPDVSMDSYNENRLAAIYWMSFMSISFFYIMNLILAVCTEVYDDSISGRKEERKKLAEELLKEAFFLLEPDEKGDVCRESMIKVMAILNKDIPEVKSISPEVKRIFFALLDKNGSDTICLEEFMDFDLVLLLNMEKESDYMSLVETKFPSIYTSRWYTRLCNTVKSSSFDTFVDSMLLLNAFTVLMQDYSILAGYDTTNDSEDTGIFDSWERLETVFTVFYVLEVILKVTVNGWKRYSRTARNLFDLAITCMSLLATIYVYYPNAYNDTDLIRFIVMARVLRLARLLFAIESFRLLGAISIDILPASCDIFLVLLFVAYSFAAIGNLRYGGYITRDPSNPLSYSLLKATDFAGNDYWANNFNDMASGMVVLFDLLVVNNWTNTIEGFECTTGGYSVRFFFLSFHLICVIGISNVITSVVINSFFQQLDVLDKRHGFVEKVEDASIRGSRAFFDADLLTGTKTGVEGKYSANVKAVNFDVDVDEREVMRRVFGRSNTNDSK